MATITPDEYDALLDYMDNEDIENFSDIFEHYNLHYAMYLEDAPRYNETNNVLETYADYAIGHGLTEILNYFIETQNFEISDDIISRSIQLNCIDTYNFFLESGYLPGPVTLKMAIRHSYSDIVESLLDLTPDLITEIDEDTIDSMFNFTIDEETLETIKILFSFNVDKNLFVKYLDIIDIPDFNSFNEEEKDHIIELADYLRENLFI